MISSQPESAAPRRRCFGHALRLHGKPMFDAVYAARLRRNLGCLTVWARPNGLTHHRLGLSVPRKVGSAVVRNAIKRRLREAFRLGQADWPGGYDLVVAVYPHATQKPAVYQEMLAEAVRALHREHLRRERSRPSDDRPASP